MLENWEALTSYDKAFFYALLDEKDRTVQWSQKAFDENYTKVTGLRLQFEPFLWWLNAPHPFCLP